MKFYSISPLRFEIAGRYPLARCTLLSGRVAAAAMGRRCAARSCNPSRAWQARVETQKFND